MIKICRYCFNCIRFLIFVYITFLTFAKPILWGDVFEVMSLFVHCEDIPRYVYSAIGSKPPLTHYRISYSNHTPTVSEMGPGTLYVWQITFVFPVIFLCLWLYLFDLSLQLCREVHGVPQALCEHPPPSFWGQFPVPNAWVPCAALQVHIQATIQWGVLQLPWHLGSVPRLPHHQTRWQEPGG